MTSWLKALLLQDKISHFQCLYYISEYIPIMVFLKTFTHIKLERKKGWTHKENDEI